MATSMDILILIRIPTLTMAILMVTMVLRSLAVLGLASALVDLDLVAVSPVAGSMEALAATAEAIEDRPLPIPSGGLPLGGGFNSEQGKRPGWPRPRPDVCWLVTGDAPRQLP
jgi:hypothetical protein